MMGREYEMACAARDMYRAGLIGRDRAREMARAYEEAYNAKARELARKHGVRPRLFSFSSFCR